MNNITFWDKLRYKFDNTMSKGAVALIGWLGLITLIMTLITALILVATHSPSLDGNEYTFGEAIWQSLIHALDSGAVGADIGWQGRMIMLGMTVSGIFILSILIGIITSGIETRLEHLRKGRSLVVEEGHIVILGWAPQVFSIISELIIANENKKDSCIVLLADKDKVEMEDEIRDKVGKTGKTRIVCRTGSPIDLADLEIVNLHTAKSIIIPSPPIDDPDSHVIKSILAITNNPQRRPEPYHIVAEIRNSSNMEVARLVGGDETQLILADDLIARITVQTSLQSGLSVVYTELLDFSGDEIYFYEEPILVGKTFGEAIFAYEDTTLMGLRTTTKQICLNPPMDTKIQAGDQIIAISTDDDTILLSNKTEWDIANDVFYDVDHITRISARTLILGWNHRATAIINELDAYLPPGSHITVVTDSEATQNILFQECQMLSHAQLEFIQGDITSRRLLDSLHIPSYQHIIILSNLDHLSSQQADARTLITLLHLRDIADQNAAEFTITSEMLEIQNRDLATVTRADDFIVSNKLISLMLSQVAENKDLNALFQDLFDPSGSEIYLKPINDYVRVDEPLNFYNLLEAAKRRGEIAIGYRIQADFMNAQKMHGVRLNPVKSKKVQFTDEDKIIVLAES